MDIHTLLQPISLDTFIDTYWGSKCLFISRKQPDFYAGILDQSDIDYAISSMGIRYPEFRLVKDGVPLAVETYTMDSFVRGIQVNGIADAEKIYAAYRSGATIILEGLNKRWAALHNLCRSLEQHFMHPFHTNVYLTPSSAQGFKPHYDTHDVFVLQVTGSKHWRIYNNPIPVPDDSIRDPKNYDIGKPTAEFDMKQGDLAYIPRGFVHDALTSDVESSHITLGLTPFTWFDVFEKMVEMSRMNADFRQALPVGFGNMAQMPAESQHTFLDLLRRFLDNADLQKTVNQLTHDFIRSRKPLFENHFRNIEAHDKITEESIVKRRLAILFKVEEVASQHINLHYWDRRISLPIRVAPTVYDILERTNSFRPKDLSGSLDTRGKIVLVKTLLKEGLLILDS